MKYYYEFNKDRLGNTRIVLPEKLSLFADFIEDISTVDEVDEYIGYIQNVINSRYIDFEITLNATSVIIKKEVTIVEHHYRIEEPHNSTMETEEFLKMLFLWRENC
ncbi:hypothetical protein BpOF4_17270 [Alkalihalophilus pseudofirmus OF4]|uniref:tRNA-Val4 n=1 Tax=Alkalihalophilus pseudofirmus (strain ATCC BAA-2126 / JCM 17055 / OF4) TaxID=398511 RepID=D3FRA4_ALKPO|nr:hypothetical protein [Alkalihalophilus pseudofirmus]ADC51495.1 hypothetical protein BpOF4_17270 [Alkalihalophilus pseudofirmus OF4]